MSATEATLDSLLAADTRVNIVPGTPVQIEIDGVAGRLQSKVVGMEVGRFLIVTLPNTNMSIQTKLYRGNSVVVRYLHDGSVVGFQSSLLAATSEPVKLLFLGCPKVIAERSLRSERRVDCRLPARLKSGDQECPVVVVDLSIAGANCVLRPGGGNAPVLARDAAVELHLQVPGSAGELSIQGVVRGGDDDETAAGVGVKFVELPEEIAQALRGFLNAVH